MPRRLSRLEVMKPYVRSLATTAAFILAACLGPNKSAVAAPYREPRGSSADFRGMLNEPQQRHVRTGVFPRLAPAEHALLHRVNNAVNRDLHYLSDLRNYGLPDVAVTEPPIRRPVLAPLPPARYADCEDYALTKKHRLTQAGFSASRTFVATATVPEDYGRSTHSVLAVPEGGEWWILNNWHDFIERASGLERWWGWKFIRPRYDSYLLTAQTRRVNEQADAALSDATLSGSGGPAHAEE